MATKKVLIVEDQDELNEAYSIVLKKEGYKVYTAFNGKEAIKIAEEIKPDLILLDLRMPVLGGIGFLERYKKTDGDTHIIVFSNYDLQSEIDQAFELGADNYVLKAMTSPKELAHIVNKTLANPVNSD